MNCEVFDLLPDIVKGMGKNISRISNKMCRRICQRFCLSARLFGTPGWSQWWSFRDILKWQYCSGEKWKVGQILVWGRTVAKLLVVFLVPSIEPIIVMRVRSMAMMTNHGFLVFSSGDSARRWKYSEKPGSCRLKMINVYCFCGNHYEKWCW